jgi:hypothetical protein
MASNNDILVIIPCTCEAGTLPLYKKQLSEAQIDFQIETLGPPPPLGWGLATGVQYFRDWATRFANYERLVVTDAFDVTFFGTREDVISNIPMDYVLQAAEKNCYPDYAEAQRIGELYPDRGEHRFVNGGMTAGTPKAIYEWADAIEKHPDFLPHALNQWFFNRRLADGSDLCHIDHTTKLFYCLFGGYSELDFIKGKPINTTYGTRPSFIHANGCAGTEGMWAAYNRSIA